MTYQRLLPVLSVVFAVKASNQFDLIHVCSGFKEPILTYVGRKFEPWEKIMRAIFSRVDSYAGPLFLFWFPENTGPGFQRVSATYCRLSASHLHFPLIYVPKGPILSFFLFSFLINDFSSLLNWRLNTNGLVLCYYIYSPLNIIAYNQIWAHCFVGLGSISW